jgi:hypothetical protein
MPSEMKRLRQLEEENGKLNDLYRSRRAGQAHLIEGISEIAATRVRYGYRRIHVLQRREEWRINPKRYRLYREITEQDSEAQGQGKAAEGSAISQAAERVLGDGLRP